MIIFKTAEDISSFLLQRKKTGTHIGFVPTMGALHKGHIGLIIQAKKECPLVVSSIFINPTQFNDPKDFEKYPSTVEQDIAALESAGCDVLFLPSVHEIYPAGISRPVNYDLGFLDTVLEAKFRPGHFQGVCQVVERLFRIVNPDNAYFGQKDYQQCMVIKKLINLLQLDINMILCPTERETSGLAMSSRNMRLSEENKIRASEIYRTLLNISTEIKNGQTDLTVIKETAISSLTKKGFIPDYVDIADAATLEPLDIWDGKIKLVALVAAFLDGVRLIDNMVIS